MAIRPKHIALSLGDFIFVIWLYWINRLWGNSIESCAILSTYTFILIFLSFNIYWEIRDYWNFRWYSPDTTGLQIDPLQIPIQLKKTKSNKILNLSAEWIHGINTQPNSPVIIYTHGFSDNREYVRYVTIPIALAGYDIVAYDCRGVGGSRRVGNKNQFVEIIADLKDVIGFMQSYPTFQNRPIYLVGASLGAMASMYQGLNCPEVKKIIAIATMADYRNNMVRAPVPFKGKWWVWLRFKLFGVPINPLDDVNEILSPVIQLGQKKTCFSNNETWQHYTAQTIYLIHAMDDPIISIKNFYANQRMSIFLPLKNWLITSKGGHMFRKYEVILIAAIIHAISDQNEK